METVASCASRTDTSIRATRNLHNHAPKMGHAAILQQINKHPVTADLPRHPMGGVFYSFGP
jgi:hypothetical protein